MTTTSRDVTTVSRDVTVICWDVTAGEKGGEHPLLVACGKALGRLCNALQVTQPPPFAGYNGGFIVMRATMAVVMIAIVAFGKRATTAVVVRATMAVVIRATMAVTAATATDYMCIVP